MDTSSSKKTTSKKPGILQTLWNDKVRFYKCKLATSRREAKEAEDELETALKLVETVSGGYFLFGQFSF